MASQYWEPVSLLGWNFVDDKQQATAAEEVMYQTVCFDDALSIGIDLTRHVAEFANPRTGHNTEPRKVTTSAREAADNYSSASSTATECSTDFVQKAEVQLPLTRENISDCCDQLKCTGASNLHCQTEFPGNCSDARQRNAIDQRLSQLVDDIDSMAWYCCQVQSNDSCSVAFDCDAAGRIAVVEHQGEEIAILHDLERRPGVVTVGSDTLAKCIVETSLAEVRLLRVMQDVFRNRLQMADDCITLSLIDAYIAKRLGDANCCKSYLTHSGYMRAARPDMTASHYYRLFLKTAFTSNERIHAYRVRNVTLRSKRASNRLAS